MFMSIIKLCIIDYNLIICPDHGFFISPLSTSWKMHEYVALYWYQLDLTVQDPVSELNQETGMQRVTTLYIQQ